MPHPPVPSSLIWACPDLEAGVGSQEGLGIPVGLHMVGVGQSFQDNYGMQGQGATGPFRLGSTPAPGWWLVEGRLGWILQMEMGLKLQVEARGPGKGEEGFIDKE